MALNFSSIEAFVAENRERIKDKALLRHERYSMLSGLRDKLQRSLDDYNRFENELTSLVVDKIKKAKSYGELNRYHRRAVSGIEAYFKEEDTVMDIHDLFRIVRDDITVRTLALVEEEMKREGYGYPPSGYVWVGLGSEGRDEQTLMTDQDNMILFDETRDDFGTDYLRDECYKHYKTTGIEDGFAKVTEKNVLDYYYQIFAGKVVERLHEVGFEKCKGGVMPSNTKWRGSLTDWRERIQERIIHERGIFESLDVIILTDARPIAGDRSLLQVLIEEFLALLRNNKFVMKDFYTSAVLMPTALSFFGNFKTEKNGEYRGKMNIKLHGWAPLILAVRMVAITNGIFDTNTVRRIRLLRDKNVIKKDMEIDLIDAYLIFVRLRILNQIKNKTGKQSDMNYLNPDLLVSEEQGKLRKAMKTVEVFQKYIEQNLLFGQPF
ncbi:MAG: putative nucleotidyltransferase substrate binding domain protein [Syntrophorhabdus sp. PtaU1.Bin002]|nr:MAG: putative nucleotidyltransferase substrate binding domain protein [Syntrophorhabdus sp. PtaU1.Bin002]